MAEPKSTRAPGQPGRPGILVCMGPGGVGKTTCAASLALAAARAGARVVVVTIDPSHRLAQALGISAEDVTPGSLTRVPLEALDGDATGQLDALLLDAGAVFDALVRSGSATEDDARRMLDNPIYEATSRYLGGAIEYAAMARMQLLYEASDHDLIVLDTPPAANALEFLEAPSRVRGLIDNPAARVVLGSGRVSGRLLGLGVNTLMKVLGRMGGAEFLRDLATFLGEFSTIIEEFHRRGGAFEEVLRGRGAFAVVVTSTANFAVDETITFIEALQGFGMSVRAAVINRAAVSPGDVPPSSELREALVPDAPEGALARELAAWVVAEHETLAAAAARGTQACRRLESAFPGLAAVHSPRRSPPPETLEELARLGEDLWIEIPGRGAPDGQ